MVLGQPLDMVVVPVVQELALGLLGLVSSHPPLPHSLCQRGCNLHARDQRRSDGWRLFDPSEYCF
jgi:hypothetical protein